MQEHEADPIPRDPRFEAGPGDLVLQAGLSKLVVRPGTGGALGGWTRAGGVILHPVADPNLAAQHGAHVGAYPLIPFSNRVADGRFSFEGRSYQLDQNFRGEPHTIHGNAWMRAWRVLHHDQAAATLALDHSPPEDPAGQWPFRYHAEIDYALRDDGLMVSIRVRNTDGRAQPMGLGFHPFFPRDVDLALGFSAGSVWHVGADSLPDARLPVEGEYRFAPMRGIDGPPLDNCYAGWTGSAFLRWPRRELAMTVTAGPPFGHLVVFTPPGRDHVAVEPASNMTDAINHPEIPDRGLAILRPGEELAAQVEFALTKL